MCARSSATGRFILTPRTAAGRRRRTRSRRTLPAFAIDRIAASTSSTRSGDGKGEVPVNVAVVDDGIDADHPDLDVSAARLHRRQAPRTHGTLGRGVHRRARQRHRSRGVAPGARLFDVQIFKASSPTSIANELCGVAGSPAPEPMAIPPTTSPSPTPATAAPTRQGPCAALPGQAVATFRTAECGCTGVEVRPSAVARTRTRSCSPPTSRSPASAPQRVGPLGDRDRPGRAI